MKDEGRMKGRSGGREGGEMARNSLLWSGLEPLPEPSVVPFFLCYTQWHLHLQEAPRASCSGLATDVSKLRNVNVGAIFNLNKGQKYIYSLYFPAFWEVLFAFLSLCIGLLQKYAMLKCHRGDTVN